jgi:ferredoxin-NADP reductase/Na+-transporting NADH:ubiquinone oxidoreductase subunit NqrB
MLRFIDSLLDRVTMYRLLLYYLIFLIGAAVILTQLGYLHYNVAAVIFSPVYLVAICWVSNKVFAYGFEAPASHESSLITALILALIISPITTSAGLLFLTAAGGLAIASKYILAINKKHVFNPAAIAVMLTGLGAGQTASWWIGSQSLLPFVLIGGVLVMRKVRRVEMVTSFVITTLAATIVYSLLTHGHVAAALQKTILSSALFFLAFVMLTEPQTSPSTAKKQRWYGALVGLLFPPQVHFLTLYSTPELALVIGNVFSYIISPRVKIFPSLSRKHKLASGMVDFVFNPGTKFSYQPGQYMEWTLPHKHVDSRGNRRYFTLASSPTENNVRLGVKFYSNGSSYKKAMLDMGDGTPIVASQLGGDFTLPGDKKQKLAFIAGGIGVTPYRSMLKYLLDTNDRRSVALLYSAKTAAEIVYSDVFEDARNKLDTNVTYCLTGPNPNLPNSHYKAGSITPAMIRREVPDYAERLFYVAGPHGMVSDVKHLLQELGVSSTHIKIDFFPGYN